mgnify:CR=1 FL=1
MNLGTVIYTLLFGKFVAKDHLGNKYYSNTKDFKNTNAKRWVVFKDSIEATKIPPHWHAWLHKTIHKPPTNYSHKYSWQKDLEPNLTGTTKAYFPSSHPLSSSYNPEKEKNDYESWTP